VILLGERALPGEEWRPVAGFENKYLVSSMGRVYSSPRPWVPHGSLLTPSPSTDGDHPYLIVDLYSEPQQSTKVAVHRLVARAFHGEPVPLANVVRHLNGDHLDNRVENLAWGTQSENNYDQVRHGRHFNAAKTHCLRGHAYDEINTYITRDGRRNCRACRRQKQSPEYHARVAS
jgi:hypothetical protein